MKGEAATLERYDGAAVLFHWIIAALIVFLGVLGLLFDDLPRQARPFWINLHGSVGLVYLALVVARLVWRIGHRSPRLPPDVGEFARRTSFAVHNLLYALMLATPALGVVAYVWHGRSFDYGLFQLNFGVASNREVFHPAEEIHQWLAYSLFALAALHILGALWHQFVKRDGLLLRILPRGTG